MSSEVPGPGRLRHGTSEENAMTEHSPRGGPAAWGRIDEDGTVYLRTADGERAIGSWQAGDPQAGLAHYRRRYDDLATEVGLLEKRLASGAAEPEATKQAVRELLVSVPGAAALGDLAALVTRLETVGEAADQRLAAVQEKRAAARAQAQAAKLALVEEAEQLAESTQWKASGDRLRAIVEQWRLIKGVDKRTDDKLWKRFAAARDGFGTRRGSYFAERDKERDSVRLVKERIAAEAEELAGSKDWAPTAARMRQLLTDWKAAGRAPREVEDALWTRLRTAQDAFFAARSATFAERDAEQLGQQRLKEAVIAEAEALDLGDLERAKAALRDLQDRYDAVGHVPRDAIRGLDSRMQEAERRVREATEDRWDRAAVLDNPLLVQLREAVERADIQLRKAQASGGAARIADAESALAARRQWLADAEQSART